MRNRLNFNRTYSLDIVQATSNSLPCDDATALCRHILVPLTPRFEERSAAIMAMRLGWWLQAKVTFLQVCPPQPRQSVHWLDAIDHLHEALSTSSSFSRQDDPSDSWRDSQRRISEWINRDVKTSLRNRVVTCIEVRFGDLAGEVARYADVKDVDLLILNRVATRWGRPVLPRPARRILKSTNTPAVLAEPYSQYSTNLLLGQT